MKRIESEIFVMVSILDIFQYLIVGNIFYQNITNSTEQAKGKVLRGFLQLVTEVVQVQVINMHDN